MIIINSVIYYLQCTFSISGFHFCSIYYFLKNLLYYIGLHNTVIHRLNSIFIENGGTSPLYRLECYNWPDVCQKIEVYTTPRMFFKPAKSQEMYEYKGMWDKTEMENHIERFENSILIDQQ